MRTGIATALLVLAATGTAAENYEALFESAVRAVTWDLEDDWAYTETKSGAEGTFVANNNIVSQSVAHLHVHVVPRTKGDGLRGFFWPRRKYEPGEAAAVADRLRSALGDMRAE